MCSSDLPQSADELFDRLDQHLLDHGDEVLDWLGDLDGENAEALDLLMAYPWPGNIRELENEVERVVVLSGDEPRVGEDMLSSKIRDFSKAQEEHKGLRVDGSLKEALEQLEKTMILEGLRRTGFNKSRLAKELGISRAGLIMKVEKYGLDKRKLARSG